MRKPQAFVQGMECVGLQVQSTHPSAAHKRDLPHQRLQEALPSIPHLSSTSFHHHHRMLIATACKAFMALHFSAFVHCHGLRQAAQVAGECMTWAF